MSIETEKIFIPEAKKEKAEIVDNHEHIVDIEAPKIKEQIEKAKELFEEFLKEYGEKFDLDPNNESAIEEVYEAAMEKGIFAEAQRIRELIYGKNISIYGVCYLSNKCDQNCKFCPMGQLSWQKWQYEQNISRFSKVKDDPERLEKETSKYYDETQREMAAIRFKEEDKDIHDERIKKYKESRSREEEEADEEFMKIQMEAVLDEWQREEERLGKKFETLELEKASQDMDAIVQVGHQEICILSGEEISCDPGKVVDYVQLAVDKLGVKEVILNMGSYSEYTFNAIKRELKIPDGVKLQHRVFQETYDRKGYDFYMEKSDPKGLGREGTKIPKRDFDFRYESQVAALKAGFDEVGVGALFGLSRHPLKEIQGLQEHVAYIKEKGGKEPKRCCLPLGNNPERSGVQIKYMIPGTKNEKKITELIYALARLAMPTISIVSSERDNPETLEGLDKYANHTTLFVHPAPGENIESLKELEEAEPEEREKPVAQAEVFSRKPREALESWKKRGYNVLGFDKNRYRQ